MKLIHCADLHLGSNLTTNLTAEQAQKRNYELIENFERMIQYGINEQVHAILLSGDVFDTAQPPMWVATACLELFQRYSELEFFYLRGNHDRHLWEKEKKEGALPANLHMFDRDWVSYVCDDIVITGVECKGDSLYEQAKTLDLEEGQLNIVMLHGAITENNHAITTEDVVPIELFRNRNIDYLALGHIHSFFEGYLDQRGRYCYSGCLEGRGFDECGQKGFVLLDLKESQITTSFIPWGKRKLYEIEVPVDGCMTTLEIARKIDGILKDSKVSGEDYIKICLVGQVDVECEKNSLYLQQKWSEQFFCFQLEDHTNFIIDYNDFLFDESLKGEFVRKIQHMDLPEEDKIEMIRYGILALSGEEITECD